MKPRLPPRPVLANPKYPKYEDEVNVILNVARAAADVTRFIPDFCVGNVVQHLIDDVNDWSWSLIDIILDYEERDRKWLTVVKKLRRLHRNRTPTRRNRTDATRRRRNGT